MSAYDKPVSKLAESPELCTGLESFKGSKQQQAQSVTPGLRHQPCQMGIRKPKKSVPRWEREDGRMRENWQCQVLPKENAKSLRWAVMGRAEVCVFSL